LGGGHYSGPISNLNRRIDANRARSRMLLHAASATDWPLVADDATTIVSTEHRERTTAAMCANGST
jgi:hypothetical protein